MEASSVLSSASSYSWNFSHHIISSSSTLKPTHLHSFGSNFMPNTYPPRLLSSSSSRSRGRSFLQWPPCALTVNDEALEHSISEAPEENKQPRHQSSARDREMLPKIDKNGRFCSPRAARELALSILYAACLEGSDPVRLFEKRVNARREAGFEFDRAYLTEYNHMSFGGPPVNVDSSEEADELEHLNDQESHIEAEVLSAPPKLVYSKLILRFTRKLLVAVVDKWDSHVQIIDKVAPANWKHEPAGRILEFSILHLAMSEISVLGTRQQIVINEAVDLAKRFCDGAAPRVVNGCLRTFLTNLGESGDEEKTKTRYAVIS